MRRAVPMFDAIPLAGWVHQRSLKGLGVCLSLLFWLLAALLRYVGSNVIDEVIPLPHSSLGSFSVDLRVKNCATVIRPSPTDESFIKMRGWRFFSLDASSDFEDAPIFPHAHKAAPKRLSLAASIIHWLRHKLFPVADPAYGEQRKLQGRWPRSRRRLEALEDKVLEWWHETSRYSSDDSADAKKQKNWRWVSEDELRVALQMRSWNPYFQCTVELNLTPDFFFENLAITSAPTDAYIDIHATQPIRANNTIRIAALHALIDLHSLEAQHISISLRDGWLKFALDGDPKSYDYLREDALVVQSRTAPVTIESSIPIDLTLEYPVASRAFVRGHQVRETRDPSAQKTKLVTYSSEFSGLLSKFSSLSIVTAKGAEAPIYLVSRERGADLSQMKLMTWAGTEHIDAPHLLAFSEQLLKEVHSWVSWAPTSPWVALLTPLGAYLPDGLWRIVSSDAFLGGNNWFVLFSGGLLKPRIKRLQAHVMGLFCRDSTHELSLSNLIKFQASLNVDKEAEKLASSGGAALTETENNEEDEDEEAKSLYEVARTYAKKWPDVYPGQIVGITRHLTECRSMLMDQMFVTLWKGMETSRTSSSMFVWSEVQGQELRYTLASNTVVKDIVTLSDTWLFMMAIAINLVVSLFLGIFLTGKISVALSQFIRQDLTSVALTNAASHRLYHMMEEVSPPSWNVIVCNVYYPEEGFLLRWTEPMPPSSTQVAVHIIPCALTDHTTKKMNAVDHISRASELRSHINLNSSTEDTPLLNSKRARQTENIFTKTVVHVPTSGIKYTRNFAVRQRELFLPFSHSKPNKNLESGQPYKLDADLQYRLQIRTLNEAGRELTASNLTPPVIASVPPLALTPAIYLLNKLTNSISKQAASGSLKMFVEKHCHLDPAFTVEVSLESSILEVYDDRPKGSGGGKPLGELNIDVGYFYGQKGESAKRQREAAEYGRAVYGRLHFGGVPKYVRTEGSHDVYELEGHLTSQAAINQDRLSLTHLQVEAWDVTTGHILASGTRVLNTYMAQAGTQFNPSDPDCKWGINWKPWIAERLNRGYETNAPWGLLKARANFSSAREMCRRELGPDQSDGVHFTADPPGAAWPLGSELVLRWVWNIPDAPKPSQIYLHLHDHETDNYILSLQAGRPIPNTGSFSWGVFVPFESEHRLSCDGSRELNVPKRQRKCYFTISIEPYIDLNTHLNILAQSNAFFVINMPTLSEFEFAYAAFCRSNNLEMEHVSLEALEALGIDVTEQNIRVCSSLRNALPFEPYQGMIHTPGQCLTNTTSQVLSLLDNIEKDLSMNTGSVLQVYKSISRKVFMLENCAIDADPYWWLSSPDNHLLQAGLLNRTTYEWVASLARVIGRTSFFFAPALINLRKFKHNLRHQTLPAVLQVWLAFHELAVNCAWPVSMAALYAIYNYGAMSLIRSKHVEVDARFLGDLVFAPSKLLFLRQLPLPGLPVLFTGLVWAIAVGFDALTELVDPAHRSKWKKGIRKTTTFLQLVQTFMITTLMVTFLLWFVLGGLINSDTFLPYAVMLGCMTFIAYTLFCNFRQAKESVLTYIESNQSTLLSVCFDRWFEANKIRFDHELYFRETNSGKRTALSVARVRDKMKRQIQKWQQRHVRDAMRKKLKRDTADMSDTFSSINDKTSTAAGDNSPAANSPPRKSCIERLRQELCWWSLEKVQLKIESRGHFYADGNYQACGLELVNSLPTGTRFATVKDVLKNRSRMEEMLIGFDVALLADGVAYGPRFGYKVDRKPALHQKYFAAIIAVPKWPPADQVDDTNKLALIFDHFDANSDDVWTLDEFSLWVEKCSKAAVLAQQNDHPQTVANEDLFELRTRMKKFANRGDTRSFHTSFHSNDVSNSFDETWTLTKGSTLR